MENESSNFTSEWDDSNETQGFDASSDWLNMEWPAFNSEQPKDTSETKADEEDERQNSKENLLIAIARGELNENDEDEKETYNYLRGLLEKNAKN